MNRSSTSEMATSLREHEIRPDRFVEEQHRVFQRDVERLLLSRRDQFTEVPCPACGERAYRSCFTKYTLTYVSCDRCGTVFINPRPTPAVLDHFYAHSENYQFWNRCIFPASEDARRKKIFWPRAQMVRRICEQHDLIGGVLLEVGAGFGTFCEEVKRTGAFRRIIAVEPTPDLAATCRQRGIETIEQRIEDAHLPECIDVVASFEVIEHLYSPEQFLRGCARVLRVGGCIILTCPNVQGFDIAVLREQSDAVDAEHLNYFHLDSLALLLERTGFTVIERLTPGKLDAELVRKKALAGEFDVTAQPFLRRVLIDEWDRLGGPFQEFLARHCLSSHMLIVGRKH